MISNDVMMTNQNINSSRPNPRQRKKIKLNFYFHTSLWAFTKPFEAPQRSAEKKIQRNFYFSSTFKIHGHEGLIALFKNFMTMSIVKKKWSKFFIL